MKTTKKSKRRAALSLTVISTFLMSSLNICYASNGSPVQGINNLSTLIFSIISAIGGVILVWGFVQLGIALKKHDQASYSEAIMSIAGGLIIACAPWIVSYVLG